MYGAFISSRNYRQLQINWDHFTYKCEYGTYMTKDLHKFHGWNKIIAAFKKNRIIYINMSFIEEKKMDE